MAREVIFYRSLKGDCPMEDFLDSLGSKESQKVLWVLNLLEELDRLPSQYFKKLVGTEEIWECRVQLSSNAYRVFCFFIRDNRVVLTHGYAKKSQKTDRKQIEKAEGIRRSFFSERGNA